MIMKKILLLAFMTCSLNAAADFDLNPIDDDQPPTDNPEVDVFATAPINDWIPYLLFAGTIYGAYFFEKRKKAEDLPK